MLGDTGDRLCGTGTFLRWPARWGVLPDSCRKEELPAEVI